MLNAYVKRECAACSFFPIFSRTTLLKFFVTVSSIISLGVKPILLRVAINILNRQDLQEALVDLIVSNSIKLAKTVVELAVEHTSKFVTILLTTIVASFVIVPSINDRINNESPQAQVAEVSDD